MAALFRALSDGRGRCFDNSFIERLWRSMKCEEVYLKVYAYVPQTYRYLGAYFERYNHERLHQILGNRSPRSTRRRALQRLGPSPGLTHKVTSPKPCLPHKRPRRTTLHRRAGPFFSVEYGAYYCTKAPLSMPVSCPTIGGTSQSQHGPCPTRGVCTSSNFLEAIRSPRRFALLRIIPSPANPNSQR